MELKAGSQLQNGKYILEKKIGEGGFGITYKGIWNMEVSNPLGKTIVEYPVAIKEFFFEEYCFRDDKTGEVQTKSDKGQELFVRFKEKLKKEAAILLKLEHPNIVNVSEVFEENNTAYMVMEFINGGSLKEFITREDFLTINESLRYIKQIAEALSYIHEHNIIHLDVKPANILIDKDGNAKLIDFGIAKQYTDSNPQTQAATMATFSKGYSPIEQYAVNRKEKYGAHTDIYALGATLYHCLTGEIPTESAARLSEDLIPPGRLNPVIPTHVERAILKAMELKHKDRFSSVAQFLDALNEEPVEPEAGEIKTKIHPLPDGFKETDTKYIIEPQAPAGKSVQGKKTVISNINAGIDKNAGKKKTPKQEKLRIPKVSETKPKEYIFDNGKLKTFGIAGAAILILTVGIASFFIFHNKEVKPGVETEISPADTAIIHEIIPKEEIVISQPVKEDIKEKTSLVDASKTPVVTKPAGNPNAETEPSNVVSEAFKKTLNINGNSYYGDVRNGKPDGKGRLTYSAHERISINDVKNTMSEPGDYIDGKWNGGELEWGTLYDSEGNKKVKIIIGRL